MDGINLPICQGVGSTATNRLWGRFFWKPCKNLWILESIPLWITLIHTSRIRFRDYFAPDLTCKSVVCYQCLTIKLLFSMLNRNFPSFTSHFEFFNPHCHMSNPVKSPLMLVKSHGFSCLDPYFCPVNPFPRRGLGGKLGQKLRSALQLEPEAFSVFLGLICHIWLYIILYYSLYYIIFILYIILCYSLYYIIFILYIILYYSLYYIIFILYIVLYCIVYYIF